MKKLALYVNLIICFVLQVIRRKNAEFVNDFGTLHVRI